MCSFWDFYDYLRTIMSLYKEDILDLYWLISIDELCSVMIDLFCDGSRDATFKFSLCVSDYDFLRSFWREELALLSSSTYCEDCLSLLYNSPIVFRRLLVSTLSLVSSP